MMSRCWRAPLVFGVLFLLYQSAEGVGALWLHSFAVQATLMSACVIVAWPLSRWLGYGGYAAYALESAPRWLAWLAGGGLLALLAKAIAVAVGLRLGVYTSPSGDLAWSAFPGWTLPLLLLSTLVPSLAEDILTRGFWYRAAGIRWRSGIAFVVFSSAVYVLNHIYRLERGPLEWAMLFCFGVAYATALWRSGNLWAALGLHWGWNLANGMLDVATVDPRWSNVISMVAHLCMALLLLAMPASARRGQLFTGRGSRGASGWSARP